MEEFENTPGYQTLVVAATEKPERRMGDSVIPAELPQWSEVRDQALKLMKTDGNQLGLHVHLIKAEANINGFNGFQESVQNMLVLMQEEWDSVFPAPDMDDPDDPYYARVNLINELSGEHTFLDSIHRLPLVSVRGIGSFSTRDIDICAGSVSGSAEDQARCQEGLIRGAFAESNQLELQGIADALDSLPVLFSSMETLFSDKTGQQNVLALDRLISRIDSCRNRFHEYADEHLVLPIETPVLEEEPVATFIVPVAESSSSSDQSSPVLPANRLNNRTMVLSSFNAILNYYEVYEPSSPLRMLTLRTREFVDKPFFALLQSLAPEYKDDLPNMLTQLQKQPLAAVLFDSYKRYDSSDVLSVIEAGNGTGSMTESGLGEKPDDLQLPANTSSSVGEGVQAIESRQQVLTVLTDIETYYMNVEPSSPIPLLIADMRKLVSKSFSELIVEFSRLLPAKPVKTSE